MPGRPLHFLICSSGLLRQARMPPRMVSLAGHPVIRMLSGGTRNATNGDRISWFANNIGVQRSWANNNNSQQSSHHPLSLKHRRRFQCQPFPFYPLSGNKNITHRWFSSLSSEEASGKDETDKKPRKEPKSKPVQSKRPPQKFPWYHSEDVLPRIDLEMKLNERIQRTFKQKAFSFLWNASTAYLMGQSRWDSLLGQKAWKDSIAENGAWAFGTGMAALWSHVFRGTLVWVFHWYRLLLGNLFVSLLSP